MTCIKFLTFFVAISRSLPRQFNYMRHRALSVILFTFSLCHMSLALFAQECSGASDEFDAILQGTMYKWSVHCSVKFKVPEQYKLQKDYEGACTAGNIEGAEGFEGLQYEYTLTAGTLSFRIERVYVRLPEQQAQLLHWVRLVQGHPADFPSALGLVAERGDGCYINSQIEICMKDWKRCP